MSIIAQILEATLNKDINALSNIYKNLIKSERIHPLYFNQNKYNELINYDFKEDYKIISCILYPDSDDLIYYYLLKASPLILNTIKEYEI